MRKEIDEKLRSFGFSFRYLVFDKKGMIVIFAAVLTAVFGFGSVIFNLAGSFNSADAWRREAYGIEDSILEEIMNDPLSMLSCFFILIPVVYLCFAYSVIDSAFLLYRKQRSPFKKALDMTGADRKGYFAPLLFESFFYFLIAALAGILFSGFLNRHYFRMLHNSGMSYAESGTSAGNVVLVMAVSVLCIFTAAVRNFAAVEKPKKKRKNRIPVSKSVVFFTAIILAWVQFIIYMEYGHIIPRMICDYDFSVYTYADMESVRHTQLKLMKTGAFASSYIDTDHNCIYFIDANDVTDDSVISDFAESEEHEASEKYFYTYIRLKAKNEGSYYKALSSFSDQGFVNDRENAGSIVTLKEGANRDELTDLFIKNGVPLYYYEDIFANNTGNARVCRGILSMLIMILSGAIAGGIILMANRNRKASERYCKELKDSETELTDRQIEKKVINRSLLTAGISTVLGSAVIIPFVLDDDSVVIYALILLLLNILTALFTAKVPEKQAVPGGINEEAYL